jgi:predicted permease
MTGQDRLHSWVNGTVRDVRYSFRLLRKTPAFTLTALTTLALAIGVNAAVFSVVDAVLLAPLPYPEPHNLALLSRDIVANGVQGSHEAVDGRTWELVRDAPPSFKRAAFSTWITEVNFAASSDIGPGAARFVQQQRVGAGFFDTLGIKPVFGRELNADEDRASGPRAVVLSGALWRSAFNGDPSVVGRSIVLRGESYTVVGVMPDGFATGVPADLWTPLRASATGEGGGENYRVLVRFGNGAEAATRGEVARIGEVLARERTRPAENVRMSLSLVPLQQGLTGSLRQPLVMLAYAVAIVLVSACVNLAGLMLARAATRRREIATRIALGSGRASLLRQMLVESLLVGVAGGAAGLVVASVVLDLFGWLARDVYTIWQPVSLGGRTVAVAALAAIGASIAIGAGAGVHSARQAAASGSMSERGRAVAGSSARWPRRVLVVVQVALGALLLAGSGLLVRTFNHLQHLDPGFDPSGVLTAAISLDDARYRTAQSVARLLDDSVARMKATYGVETAAATLGLPYERLLNLNFRRIAPRPNDPQTGITSTTYATPDLFAALGMPIRRGRAFDERDRTDASKVAIVNASFAKTYFADADPIGLRISIAGAEREVVGLVGDVQTKPGWGNNGPLSPMPLVYLPLHQINDGLARLVHGWFRPTFVVRGSSQLDGNVVRAAVQQVDPMLPVASVRAIADVRDAALAQQRLLMILLLALAAASVLVSTIGVHGLISTTVAERTREMGIRLALGATAGQALRTLALPGLGLAAVGVVVGLASAVGAARFIRAFVWGVSETDPLTFAAVAVVVLIVSFAASLAPARQILSLDPAVTLRHD